MYNGKKRKNTLKKHLTKPIQQYGCKNPSL